MTVEKGSSAADCARAVSVPNRKGRIQSRVRAPALQVLRDAVSVECR
jgi:hypothetical protein